MNVSDEYIITEWVDSFAKQESDVMKHIAKPKSNESTEKWNMCTVDTGFVTLH